MTEARSTAEVRRAQAVDAGLRAFGEHGLTTTAITEVAAEIGVSQPYIFRLFGGKRDFFLACMDELEARELQAFTGDETRSEETFEELGARFRGLVGDGTLGSFSIQALAAARTDPEIAARYLRRLATTLSAVRERTGASAEDLTGFLARGALIVQLQALAVDMRAMTATEAIANLLSEDG
ncbi:TetR/AcrR family transcriptional regulator [Ruania zhangjianzhongii]|uniref:TetR/AcrR family transcriptional regulator n=1 Tax=Ruania zhangjianzhongii TaxID=2603206 RepID=UPI00143D33A9|nr:TetR/AcrR family transcriptional regulator [Ruania zhangjianzhongii]